MTRSTNGRTDTRHPVAHAAPHLRTQFRLRGRRGVTLVEMLVATAMCILGMWMLTWMFQQATASFSQANAQATLTAQERMVTTIMTRDLEANRFPEDEARATRDGRKYQKLSDLDNIGTNQGRPIGGYFYTGSYCADRFPTLGTSVLENDDQGGFGFASTRPGNHFLQFTSIRPDEPNNRYVAEVPAGGAFTTAGTAVEVSYFLVPTGTTAPTASSPNGNQLYDLMRVQRLIALNERDKADYNQTVVVGGYGTGPTNRDAVHEVMVTTEPDRISNAPAVIPGTMRTLAEVAAVAKVPVPATDLSVKQHGFGSPDQSPASTRIGNHRFNPFPIAGEIGGARRANTSRRYGEDRLLSNVLSMEIKYTGRMKESRLREDLAYAPWPVPTPSPASQYRPTFPAENQSTQNAHSPPVWPRPFDPVFNPVTNGMYLGNRDFPYDFLPFDGRYDTGLFSGPQLSGGSTNPPIDTREFILITGVQIKIRALFGTTARQTTIVVAL